MDATQTFESRLRRMILIGNVDELRAHLHFHQIFQLDIGILNLAISCDRLEIVKMILNYGTKANPNVSLPLYIAYQCKNYTICRLLISHGVDINMEINENLTLLENAICDNEVDFVEFSLANGANMNRINKKYSCSPLHLACFVENAAIVEKLLRYNAEIDAKDSRGTTALCQSLLLNDANSVKVLLQFGANVNFITKGGQVPLHLAAGHFKNADVMKLFLSHIQDHYPKDEANCIPHYLAVYKQNIVALELLLDSNPNKNDPRNKMTFCLALLAGSSYLKDRKMIDIFLKRGYSLRITDFGNFQIPQPWRECLENTYKSTDYQFVPLIVRKILSIEVLFGFLVLKAAVILGLKELMVSLLHPKAELNVGVMDKRRSFLHMASEFGHLEVAAELLRRKADVNYADADGMTPLHFAARNDRGCIVKLLLDYGANIEAKSNNSETPLFLAVHCCSYQSITLLLNSGADVNCPDSSLMSPLHIAAEFEQEMLVQLLLQYDADIDAKIPNNETALEISLRRNGKENMKIVKNLLNNGAKYYADYQPIYFRDYHKLLITYKIRWDFIGSQNISYSLSPTRAETLIFSGDCDDEIEKIKFMKIGLTQTIGHLLINWDDDQLALILRNESYVENLKSAKLHLMFPIYGAIIEAKILRALRRSRLLKMAHHCLDILFRKSVSPLISDNILLGLTNLDLRRLIVATPIECERKKNFCANGLFLVRRIKDYVD